MGRIYKLSPVRMLPKRPEIIAAMPTRKVTVFKRKRARGVKPRVVVGTPIARALGIK